MRQAYDEIVLKSTFFTTNKCICGPVPNLSKSTKKKKTLVLLMGHKLRLNSLDFLFFNFEWLKSLYLVP